MTNFSGENLNAACGGPQGGGIDSRRNGVAKVSPKYLADVATNGVSVGYKQTEVGEIPEDWQVTTVGKVVSITTGNKNTQDKVVDGLYPFFVRSQQVERINTYSFDGEGVLTAGDGVGTGKIFHHIDGKFDFHQRVYLMYNFGDELDGYYFYIYFSNNFYDRIMSMTAKSSVDSVRREMIADMLMVMPPKSEQTAIANALSDVDALISELEKLIVKKQAIKTATMQQLLTGRTRLPQFALRDDGTPKGTKPSELGEIPEDWDIKTLDDVAKINMGQSPSSSNYNSSGFGLPLVQGNADISGRETIIRNYTSQITKKAEKGDLILSVRAPVGEVAKATFDCCIGRGVCAIRYSNEYLYHWLVSFETEWEKFSKGSTFDSINSDELKAIEVLLPSEDEQTAIATILADMDEEIQALEQRLGKTRQIKQGMMQELLTGKTRLPYDKE